MKNVATFVDIEDLWERDYLKNSLRDTVSVKSFKETADLLLDKLKDTTILSTFINSKISPQVIDSIMFQSF